MLKVICLLVVGLFVLSGAPVFAQSQENVGLPWDALIEFSGGSVAAGIGFSWGSGTLTQAGNQYPLKVEGLTLASVGITKASAYGKVYRLKNLTDINGTYVAVGTGATVAVLSSTSTPPPRASASPWEQPASKSSSSNSDSSLMMSTKDGPKTSQIVVR